MVDYGDHAHTLKFGYEYYFSLMALLQLHFLLHFIEVSERGPAFYFFGILAYLRSF